MLLKNEKVLNILLTIVLKIHSKSYAFVSFLAIIKNEGIHPKHRIIRYKEWFLENIGVDWVILDVGCNTGVMPAIMSEKAEYVYGIEIVQQHIAIANQEIAKNNIEFICADATTHDYSDFKPIDCITLSNVLEHIEQRVDFLKKLIKQVKWKEKKRFLIRVPLIEREWIAIYKKELDLEYRLDKTHFIEYTFEQFKNELTQAGIVINRYQVKFGEIYAECEGL